MYGVLVVTRPEVSRNLVDWYWRRVAGVPFLLRNAIALQRGGIDRLTLCCPFEVAAAQNLARRLRDDPRVPEILDVVSDFGEIRSAVPTDSWVTVFDASGLYSVDDVRKALVDMDSGESAEGSSSGLVVIEAMARFGDHVKSEGTIPRTRSAIVSMTAGTGTEARDGRRFRYFQPPDGSLIASAEDIRKQSDGLLSTGGSTTDSFVSRLISRPVSRQFTRWLIDTSITPNQITAAGFPVGLTAALLFGVGTQLTQICAGALLVLSTWIDGVDGEIARIKFLESDFGAKMDIMFDNIVNVILFTSIGYGLFRANDEAIYLALGVFTSLGCLSGFLLSASSIRKAKDPLTTSSAGGKRGPTIEDKLANRDYVFYLFALSLIGQVGLFLWVSAVGVIAFSVFAAVMRVRERSNHVKDLGPRRG